MQSQLIAHDKWVQFPLSPTQDDYRCFNFSREAPGTEAAYSRL